MALDLCLISFILMKKINLFGIGGHYNVIKEIAIYNGYETINLYDDNIDKFKDLIDFKGNIQQMILDSQQDNDIDNFVCIGNNSIRKQIINKIENNSLKLTKLIHPQSLIAKNVKIDNGTVIMRGVNINSLVKIGKGCIINTGSNIDHESNINDFTHICPGSTIAGNVEIGQGTFVGSGSIIINSINIGSEVKIAAGSVIYKNVGDNEKVYPSSKMIIKN